MANKDQSKGPPALEKNGESRQREGEPDLCSIILELAKPLCDQDGTDAEYVQAMLALTVFAWNQAMLPADIREFTEQAFIDCVVPADGDTQSIRRFFQITDVVETRRKRLFPDLRRYIWEFDVQICDGAPILNIVSIPLPGEDELLAAIETQVEPTTRNS